MTFPTPQYNLLLSKRYIHVGFNFVGQPITKELEPVFTNMSLDWVRYSSHCWLAYTQNDNQAWLNALKPHIADPNSMLILEVRHPQIVQGWLPPWIWEWINKPRV